MRFLSPVEIGVGTILRIACDFCSAVGVVKSVQRESRGSRACWHCGVEFLTLRLARERGGLLSTVA
jgi:hypothetical protein